MKRKRIGIAVLIAILVVATATVIVSAREYAFYYASTADQDTALIISDTGGKKASYVLTVYDAYGKLLARTTNDLGGYESNYQLLSDLVGSKGDNWGLAMVETTGIVSVGIDTILNGTRRSSTNVSTPLPIASGYTYYWYSINYANTSDESTGIAVVNPFDSPVAGTLYVYDAAGNQQNATSFLLDPHEADYYPLHKLVDVSDTMWGLVDIKATAPIVVGGEYFDATGNLMNVDEITGFYYSE